MEEGKLPPFNKTNKMMESDDDDDEAHIPHKAQRATLTSMTNVIKERVLFAGRTRLLYEQILHARYEKSESKTFKKFETKLRLQQCIVERSFWCWTAAD